MVHILDPLLQDKDQEHLYVLTKNFFVFIKDIFVFFKYNAGESQGESQSSCSDCYLVLKLLQQTIERGLADTLLSTGQIPRV